VGDDVASGCNVTRVGTVERAAIVDHQGMIAVLQRDHILFTMVIFPDTRSLTRFGAATAEPGMVVVTGCVVVVVVDVSVTQLPLGINVPLATHRSTGCTGRRRCRFAYSWFGWSA